MCVYNKHFFKDYVLKAKITRIMVVVWTGFFPILTPCAHLGEAPSVFNLFLFPPFCQFF